MVLCTVRSWPSSVQALGLMVLAVRTKLSEACKVLQLTVSPVFPKPVTSSRLNSQTPNRTLQAKPPPEAGREAGRRRETSEDLTLGTPGVTLWE